MSEVMWVLIPDVPFLVPDEQQRGVACDRLRKAFPGAGVDIVASDRVSFYSAGEVTRVSCPSCRNEISATWWRDAMERAAQREYRDLQIWTPCCHAPCSLNDLNYTPAAGFAMWYLGFVQDTDSLTPPIRDLERSVGLSLRLVSNATRVRSADTGA